MLRNSILFASIFILVSIVASCDSDPMADVQKDLCWYTPIAEALDKNAGINGKVLVVYRNSNFEMGKYGNCDLDGYDGYARIEPTYFPEDMYARSPNEIGTLILIENKKGKYLDPRTVKRSLTRQNDVDVFSGITEISLIDNKTGTVIRRTSQENTVIPKSVSEERLKLNRSSMRSEYVVEPSIDDLRNYLRQLSDKVKAPLPK